MILSKRQKASKKYRESHKEQIRAYQKRYHSTHKEEARKYRKKHSQGYLKKHPWASHYSHAKQRCTNPNAYGYKYYGGKGIKFLLTMKEVKTLYFRDNAKDMDRPSIDRVDPEGDYTFWNCRFLELSENARLSNFYRTR